MRVTLAGNIIMEKEAAGLKIKYLWNFKEKRQSLYTNHTKFIIRNTFRYRTNKIKPDFIVYTDSFRAYNKLSIYAAKLITHIYRAHAF